MTAHLKTCLKREAATPGRANTAIPAFHLVIEGRYDPAYWLHLQAVAEATFGDLDQVLRNIWLECCGHMSAFRFPRKQTHATLWSDLDAGMERERRMMDETLSEHLQKGVKLEYEYDFGSTTHLTLRVVGEYDRSPRRTPFRLLARNEAPAYRCADCGKPATLVWCGCDRLALCDKCGKTHECGEEMLLELVNSPRTGVCAYCGPSVEP